MKFYPDPIVSLIRAAFGDEKRPAYCQVATVDAKGRPHVRTVHARHIEEFETLGFNTNMESEKWRQLREKPYISGCYFDTKQNLQIRWQSPVKLLGKEASMWRLMRETVREQYWAEHLMLGATNFLPSSVNLSQPTPTFGTVICEPNEWEIVEMATEDYRTHIRTVYQLKGSDWVSKRMSLVEGKPAK